MSRLNSKEEKIVSVIQKVIDGNLSQKEASLELEITDRHVRRLVSKFKKEGIDGFAHKNRNRQSDKKISSDTKNKIITIYLSEYSDYNFTHFYEEAGKKLGTSYITICRMFKEEEIISPEAQHKTVRLYNENMRKSIKTNELSEPKRKLYEQRIEEEKQKCIRRSSNHYHFGQEIQMDATFWFWFGDTESALHLAVDKATKKVLYGWLDYQETTKSYFILLMNIILKYGIPKGIKTDKRGTFSVNNAKLSNSKLNTTQFGRICRDLKIHLSCNSNPLFKPNVERENKTFKGRLKAELRHENITTIDEANVYLNEIFIPKMNQKFSYDINPNKNDMRENIYTKEELNIIISERYTRRIDNASSIKYQNTYYVPIEQETGEVINYPYKTECIVIIAYNETLWGLIGDHLYYLLEVEKPKIQKAVTQTKAIYKGHKPSKNHPWSYVSVQKEKEEYQKRKLCRQNVK